MRSAIAFVGLTVALFGLSSCGEEALLPMEVLPVQGAAIDGSEDFVEPPEEEAPKAVDVTQPRAGLGSPEDLTEPSDGTEVATSGKPESTADRLDQELTGDALDAAKAEVLAKMKPLPEPEPEEEKAFEVDENGVVTISYRDLTLIDYDVDAMLDYMLFPEEYEGEEVQDLKFPPAIAKLDGKVVSIVGYMIPGEMDQGNVRDFMLVRDLLGCCFGGTPMPDEWLDVIMEEDAEAVYRPYMPTRVTGLLTLGGDQDEAGFALGVYKLKGTKVTVED